MIRRAYDALLLDLDGTLVGAEDVVPERVRSALRAVRERGVHVMVATGRSETGTQPVLEELDLHEPAVVFNGAGIWDPGARTFLEERVLADRTVGRLMALAQERGWLPVVQRAGAKFAPEPRNEVERRAFAGFTEVTHCRAEELPLERLMRVTIFSGAHADSAALAGEVEDAVALPMHVTHFPLSVLAAHRESPLDVLDIQPPCRGKAEGLRYLEEAHGIPAARVVAVGDASNDVTMLRDAGLGVAMTNGMSEARAAADRVIGHVEEGAVADLIADLFGAE